MLHTGSCAIDSWDFVPSLAWSGLVSDFLKGTVNPISFLWSLWHVTSPNRQSPSVASEEVEQAFCWRRCLPCHCRLRANDTAHGREVGHLPPWLSVCTSLLDGWTLFLLLQCHFTEVCFTPSCHFSLSYNFVPQIQPLDCEPNCALKSYHCPQKNVFCSAQENSHRNRNRNRNLSPRLSYSALRPALMSRSSSPLYPPSPA